MDRTRLFSYLNASIFKDLLADEDITDISYNGSLVFYLSNSQGRKKSDIDIDEKYARDFIREIANISEKQFSFSNPILDISICGIRINAIHQSIGVKNGNESISFSIRKFSNQIKINDKTETYNHIVIDLLDVLVLNHFSIVISGLPGSGKTELQKYLLSRVEKNSRVILIDNISEIENVLLDESVDVTCWVSSSRNEYTSNDYLIKNALRSNPDWLVLAEARGQEMSSVLDSALTGVPIITTIHSHDNESAPDRMARMVMQNKGSINYENIINEIYSHFSFYIHLERVLLRGKVVRYISSIGMYNAKGVYKEIYSSNGIKYKTSKFLYINRTIDFYKFSKIKELFINEQK